MAANPESVLDSVKQTLGFQPEYQAFDLDILLHINSAIGDLFQIGGLSGPILHITDSTTLWAAITTRLEMLGMIKALIYMRVRLAFDPPASGFAISAIERQIEMLEFRINVAAEGPPATIPVWWDLTGLADFYANAAVGDFGFDSASENIYVNGTQLADGYWWDLTGLADFPAEALTGEFGYDTFTGDVWRKTA